MKFSPSFKKNICRMILVGFMASIVFTCAQAIEQPVTQRLIPLSSEMRAPRPHNPYAPGAIVGNIVTNPNADCAVNTDDANLCDILNLLLLLKKEIGTVEDDVCCNSVLGVLGDACEILGMSISEFLLTLSSTSTLNCCDEIITTLSECCASLHCDLNALRCELECKLGKFNDCCDCNEMGTRAVQCDVCTTPTVDCCPVFDSASQGLSEIYCEVSSCCQQTNSNFITTWSLIEACCESTQSSINACCIETTSLLEEILATLTQCCDDLADDIFDTQEIIIACCQQTNSNFEITWSIIENLNVTCSLVADLAPVLDAINELEDTLTSCCEQNQTNFETTWSLIENLNFTCSLVADLTPVLDAINEVEDTLIACCAQTNSNFEVTATLLELLRNSFDECCQQTLSDFQTTWSLINNLNFTCSLTADLTPIIDAINDVENTLTICCAQNQTHFQATWSLINDVTTTVQDCCEQTQSNFAQTASLLANLDLTCSLVADLSPILDAVNDVENTLTACCAQNQTHFETTWSLINDVTTDVQNCCAQTQSNFEATWSLIENLNFTCSLTIDLDPVLNGIDEVQNTLTACCAQNQTNFQTTWSLLTSLDTEITECCNVTQSLIENILTVLNTTNDLPCGEPIVIITPTIITTPGYYCVGNNINSNASPAIIDIAADNVVIDLNRFSLQGTTIGIRENAHTNIIIMNGTISVDTGVQLIGGRNITISDVNFTGCSLATVSASANMNGLLMSECNFYQNSGYSFIGTGVQNTNIDNCSFYNNNFNASSDSMITYDNSFHFTLNNSRINNNTISSTNAQSRVIAITASSDIDITNCSISNNTCSSAVTNFSALYCLNNDTINVDSLIINNNAANSTNCYGMLMDSNTTAHISNCICENNQSNSGSAVLVAGYTLRNCIDMTLQDSIASKHTTGTTPYGILIEATSNSSVINNQLLGNTIGFSRDNVSFLFVFRNFSDSITTNYAGSNVPRVTYDPSNSFNFFVPAPTSLVNISRGTNP